MRGAGAQPSAAEVSPAKQDKEMNSPSKQEYQPHLSGVQVSPGKCHHLPGAMKVSHLQEIFCVSKRNIFCPLIHSCPRRSTEMKGATSVQHCLAHMVASSIPGTRGFLELSEEAKLL